ARLGQNLDGNVGRYFPVLDEKADEIEIGLRGRRKADFDLLEAHGEERIEHAHLALMAHGLDERLVAVSEVYRAPYRRPGDCFHRPLPFRQMDLRERPVFLSRIDHHRRVSWLSLVAVAGSNARAIFRAERRSTPPESPGNKAQPALRGG